MNGELILKAITDIDDRFILEAADEEHIREVFSDLTEKDGFTDDDFVNAPEGEQTESDTKRKSTKRTHKVSFKKILLVAVISALIFAVASTVSAYVFDFNIKEELVEFFDDHIRLHLDKVDSTADSYSLLGTDLAKELEKNGISPITLPAALLTEEWKVVEITKKNEKIFIHNGIRLESDANTVIINITQYTEEQYVSKSSIRYPNKGTELDVNGLQVFVFDLKREPYIKYRDSKTKYSISLNTTYETALEIAKTIK